MSLITTLPSQRTTERVTRQQIMRRYLRETKAGTYGTATSGDGDYLIDTTVLKSGQYSAEEFEKCWIYIDYTTDGAAPLGNIRAVSAFDPELGRIDVSPPFDATIGAGDTYQLIRWPHPQELLDHIDELLTDEMWLPTYGIATYVPDGDMELSGTTDWTGTNATIAKVTSEPKMGGRRALSVTDGGSGGGYAVNADAIYVEPSETFHISALLYAPGSTSGTLEVRDHSDSSLIDSITVSARDNVVRPYMELRTGSSTTRIQIRLVTDTASGVTYWDDVILFPIGAREIPLPNWVHDKSQVKAVFRLQPEEVNLVDVWSAEYNGGLERSWDPIEDAIKGGVTLRSRTTTASLPLFFLGTRKEEAFSSSTTDYKAISSNFFHAALCHKLYSSLGAWPGGGTADQKWIDKQLARWEKELRIERYANAQRIESILAAPSRKVMM